MILNNKGYVGIRGGQNRLMGRHLGSEFQKHRGNQHRHSADFVALAKSFGMDAAWRVDAGANLARCCGARWMPRRRRWSRSR